ncbi:fibrinogen alpha chain [Teleopsis dalmanni]|uniref:fibrinogen alpha chain n=1 Tax=Teleopsis dalmanni TaxID=139649 RepID=UPI0018CD74A9|nr:fibrinogen alpha chain [Teleopsis dalmanni]
MSALKANRVQRVHTQLMPHQQQQQQHRKSLQQMKTKYYSINYTINIEKNRFSTNTKCSVKQRASSSSAFSSASMLLSKSRFTKALFLVCILCALVEYNAVECGSTGAVRPGTGGNAPRLPRTSASQLYSGNGSNGSNTSGNNKLPNKTLNTTRNGNLRNREQQLLNIFEVIISTLEGKLKRIDNLDKSVEHMMRRMEALDNRVADNIIKTDSVISKLNSLDIKLSNDINIPINDDSTTTIPTGSSPIFSSSLQLDNRLVLLDQKVSDIDSKLEVLKTQIDNNFLQVDDINVEASEKKPISMNVIEITKAMLATELNELRDTTDNIDKKLQFHINIVSENVGRMLRMVGDIHEAVVDHNEQLNALNATTTALPIIKSSKIDALVKQIRPMVSVSEKMDEVWDVVVGTKSSVDHLLPKSDALLTQTQRQERAIGEIHHDLKTKTNLIINNLDMVEKRLKKQEDDVQILAQRPVPPELLMDPTIDRLVEYDPNRYSIVDEITESSNPTTPLSTISYANSTSVVPTSVATPIATTASSSTVPVQNQTATTAANTTSTTLSSVFTISANTTNSSLASSTSTSTSATAIKPKKGGIIFPSVKNKPSVVNTTFSTDILTLKDIKGFSCVDLLNAGMRQSGVFYLQIRGTTYWFLKVFCEQEVTDGGWTVIQRRDDYGEPRENFNRDWADYKNGFGDPAKEFWLGNENIYMLTNNEDYALRVELEDFEGNKRYAQYSHFKIHSEADYYKLEIDGYDGNAGDSLNDPWYGSNNSPFSTYNRDNDRSSLNCASMLKGGWWWKSCGRGLNGLYLHDPQDLTARQGIVWFRWRGWDYTLKKATMMIRPRAPQPMSSTVSTV